ncbi:antibiotic biosynthesis monooxygenase [Aureibacter tunicatorum]|nr:antibiotic biosynthesis monooxygenase [Aureibacter tunicatorum]
MSNELIANTPKPPYYAVVFTSVRVDDDGMEYGKMAELMGKLASEQEGFLGVESAREQVGITVSYWKDEASILKWKQNLQHRIAQEKGKSEWYQSYRTRVCKVERDYGI